MHVIDLDGSVAGQDPLRRRIDAEASTRIDAADLASSLRILATRRAMDVLVGRLRASAASDEEPSVTFYGSGDFHHVTAALLAGVRRDVTVIHFDNHPDWVRFPPTFNCGAWVNRALELPQVKRVVTIGPCSADLVRPELQFANLTAVSDGRIVLYPGGTRPRASGAAIAMASRIARRETTFSRWRNLADEDWAAFLDELVAALPTRAIWLTIDKDVLGSARHSPTGTRARCRSRSSSRPSNNWRRSCEIVGVDVCGDYSPPRWRPFQGDAGLFRPSSPGSAVAGQARDQCRGECVTARLLRAGAVMTLSLALWFVLSVTCDVAGQLCLKLGADDLPDESGPRLVKALLRQPWIVAGVAIYIVEIFVWLRILAEVPLSIAFPVASLNFLGVTLASSLFLGVPSAAASGWARS